MMTDTLDSLYSLYRPDIAAFTKIALALGHTEHEIDTFLDAPADEAEDEADITEPSLQATATGRPRQHTVADLQRGL